MGAIPPGPPKRLPGQTDVEYQEMVGRHRADMRRLFPCRSILGYCLWLFGNKRSKR